MEGRGDTWESPGWEAAWQQPEENADRDEVLRLARHLAEARERQNVEALLQVDDLKRALRERVKSKLGRLVTIGRSANLTAPLNGRAQCHYCGPCERGCTTHSYFNSAFTTVADARRTGKLKRVG